MHHDAAMPHHRTHGGVGFIVQRHVPLGLGHIGTQGATHLHRFDGAATAAATTEIKQQFAQAQSKGAFHQTTLQHIAGDLERQGAGGAAHAKVFVKTSALGHDDGHAGQGDDVVDDGGLAKQAF